MYEVQSYDRVTGKFLAWHKRHLSRDAALADCRKATSMLALPSDIVYRVVKVEPNADPRARVEAIRAALRAESVSYGELAELQALRDGGHVADDDIELLAALGHDNAPANS